MRRRLFALVGAVVIGAALLAQAPVTLADARAHRLVIHVDDNDAKRMNIALNNAANVVKYYRERDEEVEIEIVAYGPGLHMLREDTSPVRDRIIPYAAMYENIGFRACGNTFNAMTKKEGKEPPLMDIAERVPSGVVHLMQRQEEGWSYVRP